MRAAALARATRGAGWSPKKSGTRWSRTRKVEKPRSSMRLGWLVQALGDWGSSWMTPKRNGRRPGTMLKPAVPIRLDR